MKLTYYNLDMKKNIGILGYETCGFRATINQKHIYLIGYYAISGFGWNQLYKDAQYLI